MADEPGEVGLVLREICSLVQESNPDLAEPLNAILSGTPIEKPIGHTGDTSTDWFFVALDFPTAEAIGDLISQAEVDAVGVDGSTTPAASLWASYFDEWHQYLEVIE